MGAPKTGGRIVGHCVGAKGVTCGRPLASRRFAKELGLHENYGSMRCRSCARYHEQPEGTVRRKFSASDGRVKIYPKPGAWVQSAACAGKDSDRWFPAKGGSFASVKLICKGCPVIEQCRQYALDNRIKDGIWGATTWPERERLLGEGSERAA